MGKIYNENKAMTNNVHAIHGAGKNTFALFTPRFDLDLDHSALASMHVVYQAKAIDSVLNSNFRLYIQFHMR